MAAAATQGLGDAVTAGGLLAGSCAAKALPALRFIRRAGERRKPCLLRPGQHGRQAMSYDYLAEALLEPVRQARSRISVDAPLPRGPE